MTHPTIDAALDTLRRGYQPVPIYAREKRPYGKAWNHQRFTTEAEVVDYFTQAVEAGATNIGVQLGKPSGGLVDVDLDHAKASRMRDYFLPRTPMQSERLGHPRSHRWYLVEDELPATRPYKMPDKASSVELRSTGSQTVIPPSVHPTGEVYQWVGEPFGGEAGPAVVPGRKLALQVALLSMGAVLLDKWPRQGSRHEAYLSLAGGLLRSNDEEVDGYWRKNLPSLIRALASATDDDDGPETRVHEVMKTTLGRLQAGSDSPTRAVGFPTLGRIIGEDHVDMVRRMVREVNALSGHKPQGMERIIIEADSTGGDPFSYTSDLHTSSSSPSGKGQVEIGADEHYSADQDDGLDTAPSPEKEDGERDPLEERVSTWAEVDLGPYLAGDVELPEPDILIREDHVGLFYPGRVNSLFGASESAKTWVALHAGIQLMQRGDRVLYLDFEDEPMGTLDRMQRMQVSHDEIKTMFRYVHPESPLAPMQRNRFGAAVTTEGLVNQQAFAALLSTFNPALIIVDGMTDLYGLHGLETNDASDTSVVTRWLKSLTRGGRSGVIIIDHTGKNGGAGSSPSGSHHKKAMVQGNSMRVDVVNQPMPGALGHVQLLIFKDRIGYVRSQASRSTAGSEQIAADVHIDSRVAGVTTLRVEPPKPGDVVIGGGKDNAAADKKLQELSRLQDNCDKIMELFGGDTSMCVTTRMARDQTGLSQAEVYDAWRELVQTGYLVQLGVNKGRHYRIKVE